MKVVQKRPNVAELNLPPSGNAEYIAAQSSLITLYLDFIWYIYSLYTFGHHSQRGTASPIMVSLCSDTRRDALPESGRAANSGCNNYEVFGGTGFGSVKTSGSVHQEKGADEISS